MYTTEVFQRVSPHWGTWRERLSHPAVWFCCYKYGEKQMKINETCADQTQNNSVVFGDSRESRNSVHQDVDLGSLICTYNHSGGLRANKQNKVLKSSAAVPKIFRAASFSSLTTRSNSVPCPRAQVWGSTANIRFPRTTLEPRPPRKIKQNIVNIYIIVYKVLNVFSL